MIHYIVQTVAFQLLFLLAYDLFLRKETFFNANRVYLLLTPILSLGIPLIKVPAIRERIPEAYLIQLPELILSGSASVERAGKFSPGFELMSLQGIWAAGIGIAFILFGIKLFRIIKLKRSGSVLKQPHFTIIKLKGTTRAFTFFHNIFMGEDLSEEQKENILLHEKVHVFEKHSWDLLFFELLRILFWWNPLVYIFQQRMATLQEYIADMQVVVQKPSKHYYQELLSQVFQTEKISFINTFFNRSLIKNRIIMLQKSRSKKIFQLKYLMLLPIIGAMLVYTSCADGTGSGNSNENEATVINQIERNNSKETKQDIPFAVIDKAPVFPGCESSDNEAAKKCTAQKIGELVGNSFNTKIGDSLDLPGRNRISVQFKIDDEGNIVDVKAHGPHPDLELEAVRVVSSLPKMTPGEHKGNAVSVLYALPIVFEFE